ncbi:GNAT family N-acetyltransferase [Planctobacterium marinum]|uniref:GNAT family N-acetyltransferase n=1 Tax=Planctobacterium marinum TaxID=1631968 RepID=UPI001E48804A|nr:GNAT family N-acetyltransferase [Planctobacterium marinum]MCC2606258.1 GNAT family N-acetyltransferase [Planctobacterium marinum]
MMRNQLSGYGVNMLPIEKPHLELLRQWRNSDFVREQMVSGEIIDEQQQLNWFQNISERQDQQHFIIQYRADYIGAANLKSCDGKPVTEAITLEPGIYIGDERYRSNILAFAPSLVLLDYCFDYLKVNQVTAKVKSQNSAALSYNGKLGYAEVDKDREYTIIALERERYIQSTGTLKNLLSRQRK